MKLWLHCYLYQPIPTLPYSHFLSYRNMLFQHGGTASRDVEVLLHHMSPLVLNQLASLWQEQQHLCHSITYIIVKIQWIHILQNFTFYCSNVPCMFNNIKLILHIGLTWIHLHICVPEKKCYRVIWTYPSQQDSFLVTLWIDWQGSIWWQQKIAFSIALSWWRRQEKVLRTKLYSRTKNSVPGLYQVYMGFLDCQAT